MGAATLLIFIAVLHRFGTGVSFLYPYLDSDPHRLDPGTLHLHVHLDGKFGAAYGVRTGIHVGVDVLIDRLNDRWRRS